LALSRRIAIPGGNSTSNRLSEYILSLFSLLYYSCPLLNDQVACNDINQAILILLDNQIHHSLFEYISSLTSLNFYSYSA